MLPEHLLAPLRNLLTERIGLNFSNNNWNDLEYRIADAAKQAGCGDAKKYINHLLSAPIAQAEIETLARYFTIGETYFFRDKRSFDALASHLLPELLRTRELTQRRLRIWSAGCCTGEEAYSIAILLDRLLPYQQGWDISIMATDINPQFLQQARQGIYTEWSFRGTPDWVRKEYFKKKRNGTFEVLPKIRERVDFSYLNLTDGIYPSSMTNTDSLDAIFCRNVLMYFSTDQASRVIDRFRKALRDGGLLLVSPAETSTALFKSFSLVNYPGAIFYRLDKQRAHAEKTTQFRAPPAPANQMPAAVQKDKLKEDRQKVRNRPQPNLTQTPTAATSASASDFARSARQCADEGRLDEAAQCCTKAIAADKLNAAFYYLLATIEQERGMIPAAIEALQRTLYLDQDFVLAHFALANLRLIEGRRTDVGRHLAIVHKLLKTRSPHELLAESDGLTAGRLDEIAASLTASLAEPRQITAVYG